MAHHVAKFFVDPGRHFKQEMQRLEEHIKDIEEDNKKLIEVKDESIKSRDQQIGDLEARIKQVEDVRDQRELKRSARNRLLLCLVVFLLVESAVGYFAWKYGKDSNLFLRLIAAWPILGVGAVATVALSWFIVGKKRFLALGWAFQKAFKIDK
jgi:hypothetical protein